MDDIPVGDKQFSVAGQLGPHPSLLSLILNHPNAGNWRTDWVQWASLGCCNKQPLHLGSFTSQVHSAQTPHANQHQLMLCVWGGVPAHCSSSGTQADGSPTSRGGLLTHPEGKTSCGELCTSSSGFSPEVTCYFLHFICQSKSRGLQKLKSNVCEQSWMTITRVSLESAPIYNTSKFFSNFCVFTTGLNMWCWEFPAPSIARPEDSRNSPQGTAFPLHSSGSLAIFLVQFFAILGTYLNTEKNVGRQDLEDPYVLWLSQRILIYDHVKLIYILTNISVGNNASGSLKQNLVWFTFRFCCNFCLSISFYLVRNHPILILKRMSISQSKIRHFAMNIILSWRQLRINRYGKSSLPCPFLP